MRLRKAGVGFVFCFLVLMAAAFFSAVSFVSAQEVMRTEVGFDSAVADEQNQGKEVLGPKVPRGQEALPQGPQVSAPEQEAPLTLDEQQMTVINKSLKNAIDENKKLLQEKEALDKQMGEMRGQNEIRINRINALTRQRDDLQKRITDSEELQKKYGGQLEELKASLAQKESEFQAQIKELKDKSAQDQKQEKDALQAILPTLSDQEYTAQIKTQIEDIKKQAQANLQNLERNTQEAVSEIDKLNSENKSLKEESAKMHYNLANLFFGQGNHQKAFAEYRRVVDLMPFDPAAHYNLAFVAGDFLNDYKTALEHYQQYLFLLPNAPDASAVKEKILEAQLQLKASIASPIDSDRAEQNKKEEKLKRHY